jgi:hypothetical protein
VGATARARVQDGSLTRYGFEVACPSGVFDHVDDQ